MNTQKVTPEWADGTPFNLAGDSYVWVEDFGAHFHQVGLAAELLNRNYRGWYLHDEPDVGELARGVVLEREHGGPSPFHPAILDPYNDGAAMVSLARFGTVADAAHSADEAARQHAESERDHHAAYQAGLEAGELLVELRELRADLENIIENRPVSEAARAEAIRKARLIRSLVESVRWRAPETFDTSFADGALEPWADAILEEVSDG